MNSKYCSNCGNGLSAEVRFCSNCGKPVANPKQELESTGPRVLTFQANSLLFTYLPGSVNVESYTGDEIEVTIKGDEEVKQQASCKMLGDGLWITAPFMDTHGSPIAMRGNISTHTSNGVIYINGREWDQERTINVTVRVPKGTAVTINGSRIDSVTIGDTYGPLELNISAGLYVEVGIVENAEISASSSSNATVKSVTGDATIEASSSAEVKVGSATGDVTISASSSGEVHVKGGSINNARVAASSSGEVHIKAVAQQARLSASSSGYVHLQHCIAEPRINMSSSGRVRVGSTGPL